MTKPITKMRKMRKIGNRTFIFKSKRFANGDEWQIVDIEATKRANGSKAKPRKEVK